MQSGRAFFTVDGVENNTEDPTTMIRANLIAHNAHTNRVCVLNATSLTITEAYTMRSKQTARPATTYHVVEVGSPLPESARGAEWYGPGLPL